MRANLGCDRKYLETRFKLNVIVVAATTTTTTTTMIMNNVEDESESINLCFSSGYRRYRVRASQQVDDKLTDVRTTRRRDATRRKRNSSLVFRTDEEFHQPASARRNKATGASILLPNLVARTRRRIKSCAGNGSNLLTLPLNPQTIKMCHQFVFLLLAFGLLLLSACAASNLNPASPYQNDQIRFVGLADEPQNSMPSDLLLPLPPYAPTRRPSGQLMAMAALPNDSLRQQHQHHPQVTFGAASSLTGGQLAAPSMVASQQQQQQQQQQNQPQQQAAAQEIPRVSGSQSKFSRTNELDVFLDDMNHHELRTVASGQPIGDLFQPKQPPQQITSNHSMHEEPKHRRQIGPPEATGGGGNGDNLDSGVQSRQQIYSECALILQRTYVKNIDDPKHQLVPFGKTEQACISYKDIDKAVEQAKHQLKFRELAKKRKKLSKAQVAAGGPPIPPFDIIHATLEPPEDLVAAVGEINMATTQIIADQFDLSNDELLNGLPLIDMSKTKFWDICPLLVKQDIKCEISRFRTFTGHCNNLKHPTWGAAMTPFARYLPPVHPDGIWLPRKSIITEVTFDLPTTAELHHHHHTHIHHNLDSPDSHSSGAPTVRFPVFSDPVDPRVAHGTRFPVDPDRHAALFSSRSGSHRHHMSLDAPDGEMPDEMAASSSIQFSRHAASELVDELHENMFADFHDVDLHRFGYHRPMGAASAVAPAHLADGGNSFSMPQPMAQPPPPVPLVPEPTTSLTTAPSQKHHHHRRPMPVDLPSARLVTSVVHRDMDIPAHDFSILFMSWGQLLDHDMTRAAQPPSTIKCCTDDGQPKHKLCLPISVPPNDPFYSKFNVQCLEFRRTLAGVRPNCVLGPRVHQNAITSPIDANFVYGSSQAQADALRLFKGGRLRDRDWFKREGLKPLLPGQEINPDLECIARPQNLFCFLAGDVRANEQTHLTVLHTLYMREHNRMADRLSELNPHWDDERTYQETRHIMAAGVQHVLVNEYIPLLIGKKMTELYNLTAQSSSHHEMESAHGHHNHHRHHNHHMAPRGKYAFWHGYDPSVTTSVSNSFAAAAFRQGHTFVQGSVERYNKFHEFVASEKLRHLFKQPFLLYQPGVMDELTGGMINQPAQSYDPFLSEDISGHLFQPPELAFGHDLAAINLQRGRDQGLPGYNLFREWCGLPRAETFEQLEPYLTNRTAFHYSRLYKHVDDIDLWSGGISERKLPGAAIGPTFACIIARQFSNTRRGDRFWYENPGLPSSFTPEQLAEIRKISLAKILCANSDDLPTIQRWALRMAHPVLNPRLACHELPEIDLNFWQEE